MYHALLKVDELHEQHYGFRSTQIQIAPSFFGTTTIPAHHSLGISTLEMTRIAFIRSKFFLDFGIER
jgi:hypothetical protein